MSNLKKILEFQDMYHSSTYGVWGHFMKIKLSQLRKIIREEVQRNLTESSAFLSYMQWDGVDEETAEQITSSIEMFNDKQADPRKQILTMDYSDGAFYIEGLKRSLEQLNRQLKQQGITLEEPQTGSSQSQIDV